MTVDAKVATLHEFAEWRQENGLYVATWDTAVAAYEAHLRTEERADVVNSMRELIRGEAGADLSVAEREEQLIRLLESIT